MLTQDQSGVLGMASESKTLWRAEGPYTGNNASKAGLLDETRHFLLTYAQLGDLAATRQALLDGGLPQRSRVTRQVIIKTLRQRLLRWNPPQWVLKDLAAFAANTELDSLRAALLLHTCRQDTLLYDVVQHVILPSWHEGSRIVTRADVQRFLDTAQEHHPEIEGWSHETREKLAGNVLSILRDYGQLQGTARKQIVAPIVPLPVVMHLKRLLQAEGIPASSMVEHPDWHIWLWEPPKVEAALDSVM
jgi:hypothetical protein